MIEKDVALIKIRRIALQTHKRTFEKSNRNKIDKGNLKTKRKKEKFCYQKVDSRIKKNDINKM